MNSPRIFASSLLLAVLAPAAALAADTSTVTATVGAASASTVTTAAEPSIAADPAPSTMKKADVQLLGGGLDFSGYFWVDTGYLNRTNAQPGQYDQIANYMQGRFVLAAQFERQLDEYFARARVELMGLVNEFAKNQYEPHTLDAYLMVGKQNAWDLQVGRFLAWEVYYRGQGIELFTAEEAGALDGPTLYLLDYTRGFRNEAGQVAVHAYPWRFLKFELAGVYGQESSQNNLGVRPVVSFEAYDLQLVVGYEWFEQFAQTAADKVNVTSSGFAGRLQYHAGPATFGVVGARTSVEYIDIQELVDTDKSLDKTSVGGFVDLDFWQSSIGLGYHRTMQENQQGEARTHDQAFLSYLHHLPFDGLTIKAVYGFAQANIEDVDTGSEWKNTMHSVRVRLAYTLD